MGVPAFYRWISEKYGKIVVDMLERRESVIDGTIIPLNLSEPNPNGIEYDNLYVDMNGLIHPCSHPEDREAPKTEIEMYINVTKYIDRLLAAVRPRRLLFMAIDGVAPRAKMNQQRSRRFRAAQEADEKKSMLNDVVGEMVNLGYEAPEEKDGHNWDSNVITPGTDFMVNLSVFMKYYILCKMNTDPFWKSIKVIISDANEPGEGEHKIMDFIRSQRNSPGFDPNQRHILHGLDADLIMLALATHEAHFSILREKVSFGNRQDRDKPEKSDAQRMLDAQSAMCGASVSSLRPQDEWVYSKPLQVLHVNILREYLDNEFASLKSAVPFGYDIERIIDDFIFLCFFVGNDFLPHLPCLDIRDGALDFLIECYKQLLPSLGGYLSSPGGNLNLREVDVVLGKVGEIEDQIFAKRKQAEDVAEKRREHHKGGFGRGGHKRQNDSSNGVDTVRSRDGVSVGVHEAVARPTAVHATASQPESDSGSISIQSNMLAASKLKGLLGKRSVSLAEDTVEVEANAAHKLLKVSEEPVDPADVVMPDEDDEAASVALEDEDEQPAAVSIDMDSVLHKIEGAKEHRVMSAAERESMAEEIKRRLKEKEQSLFDTYKESIVDHVKLHESGWKDRYYGEKYKKENIAEGGGLRRMCESYVQGLCWVMKYYYEGVPSWNWYYPFHYAPFASDLVNIDTYSNLDFTKSQPFRPVEQLLAVLPANSVHALPPECQWLMLDPASPIIDLYNGDVPIDPNGKHLPWLWILLLPFVDERRIMAAFQLCQPKLSLQERRKNALGGSVMYVHEESVVAREAQQSMQYGPGVETDPDVLDALRGLSAQLVAMDDPTAATEREALNTVEAVPSVFSFDARLGGGLGGCLSKVHPLAFAPLHLPVKAPFGVASQAAVPRNRVMSFGYSLPPCHAHLSELLPGVVHQESLLTDHDLMPRRPPRLNKVGFNVVDLYHSLNRSSGQHCQQPSYQHNRDYQLTGQFQERQFHGQQRQQWDNASGSFGQQMGHASHGGGSQYQQRNGGYSQHGQQYHDNRNSQQHQQQHQSGGWGYSQQHQGVQSRSGATHYGPNNSFGFPQHQQQYGGVGGYNDGAGQQQSFRHEQQQQGYGREAGQGPRQTVFLDHRVQQQQQQQQQHFNSRQQQQQQSQSFLRQPAPRYQQQPGGPVPSMDSIRNQLMQTLQQQQQQPNQTYGQQARPYNSQRPF